MNRTGEVTPVESAGGERTTLPLWRLTAGILVLVALAGVLVALAPVYLEDYQLRQYLRTLVRQPQVLSMPDDSLRAAILDRAHRLDLPVHTSDITISHTEGKLHIQARYVVQMDFPLYQVDLHLGSGATSP
jgi:hypothetical protein